MRAIVQVTGVVQGVGFRPFVYHLALKHRLKGFCRNVTRGVLIEVESDDAAGSRGEEAIEAFVHELRTAPPPLSRIDTLSVERLAGGGRYRDFSIRESHAEEGSFTLISPDIAVCPDCLKELQDPHDRRYRYPFINCTSCGPRYSIVRDIPYDRAKTTMAAFPLCAACAREYHDPGDRRFHAQPNACPACGPNVELIAHGARSSAEDPIQAVVELLKQGAIVAVKGLGGFHLCCDATNEGAVGRLRERKRKSNKPFALMVPDAAAAGMVCFLSDEERRLLESRIRPIVLLRKRLPSPLAAPVAPGNDSLGVMLPYTPLHCLLFLDPPSSGSPLTALVMTSGNRTEEPIVITNEEALEKLSPLADAFLLHNRDIYMRVDDSIVHVLRQQSAVGNQQSAPEITIVRRARGFVPETIEIGEECGAEVLACGADLKNTFCLTKGTKAIVSQHIGDLEHYAAQGFFRETLKNLKNTFRVEPAVIAHDLHPDYFSTKLALAYAEQHGIPSGQRTAVQHHHAHIAACMAEHGLTGAVIGIAFDGAGYGDDGAVWGGEVLRADRASFERVAHLGYVPLPGGDRAAREPWRCAAAYLYETFGEDALAALPSFAERFDRRERDLVMTMIRNRINTPLTSSAGRLFDAAASLLGIRDRITYEGEAAVGLEMAAHACKEEIREPYPYNKKDISPGRCGDIDVRPMIRSIVGDIKRGVAPPVIARRFHHTLAAVIVDAAVEARSAYGIHDVVLSGGVFQNRLLYGSAAAALREAGFTVRLHRKVPVNDGCISLGQAIVACERAKRGV
ncbi:MAG: carbamoyltransferase HypF [Nitrospirota bacterium]